MKRIDVLKNTNTILIFILLVGAIVAVGILLFKLRKPANPIHVSVDSLQLNKK